MYIGEGGPESFFVQMEWYGEVQDACAKEAQSIYTRVPAELLPRLLQMLRFCRHMTEYDGTQEDFPEKPAAACALPYAMP